MPDQARGMRFLTRLKSLQALEASARHGSFVGAALELDVTPAAVGQLVRSLEDWVGYPLFRRSRSGTGRLTPVDEAREALEDIAQGLDLPESGLKKLRGRRARSVVVVTASQALVANWLLSRLVTFPRRIPQSMFGSTSRIASSIWRRARPTSASVVG